MKTPKTANTGATTALLVAAALLAGCGDMKMKVWPFGDGGPRERSREPLNAAEYQCAAGKRFHLRMIDGGAAAWLILPEREVRLERIGGSATRSGTPESSSPGRAQWCSAASERTSVAETRRITCSGPNSRG